MNAYDRTIQHKSGSKYFPLSPSPWNYTIPYCEFKFFNCLQCFHWKQLTGLRDLLLMIAGRKGRLGRWHLIKASRSTSPVTWGGHDTSLTLYVGKPSPLLFPLPEIPVLWQIMTDIKLRTSARYVTLFKSIQVMKNKERTGELALSRGDLGEVEAGTEKWH